MDHTFAQPPGMAPEFLCDRAAVGAYLLNNADRIRAVARRKLSPRAKHVYDSEEILSSVLRRVDTIVMAGELRPRSEAELWALIDTIAKHNAINRTRLIERARNLLTEDGPYVYELLKRLNAYSSDDEATMLVYRMMA